MRETESACSICARDLASVVFTRDYEPGNYSPRPPGGKGKKAKAYNTCRAPQVTYRDFRGAGHVTGQASV